MEINKLKKIGKEKYKVYFNNTDIILYEDIILKYNLLCNKNIDIDLIEKVIEENKYYEAYFLSLSYIEKKMRNQKEIEDYLKRKEYSTSIINYVLDKLSNMGLINDIKYIEAFINDKILLSSYGPYKIKNELINLDLDANEIDNYLNKISSKVWREKLQKIVDKKLKLLKNKSYFMLINKLKNDLYNLGYDSSMIEEVLSNIECDNNESLNKEIDKLIRLKKDKNKIISSLLRKGYSYEEIINVFNSK